MATSSPLLGVRLITYGLPRVKQIDFKKAMRRGYGSAAIFWQENYSRLHFTTRGARRYRMKARLTKEITTGKIKTTKSGKPRAPSGNPLEWSGRTKGITDHVKIIARYNGAKITANARALNFKNPKNPIDMRAEYRRTLPTEKRKMERQIKRTIERDLKRNKVKVAVQIGV